MDLEDWNVKTIQQNRDRAIEIPIIKDPLYLLPHQKCICTYVVNEMPCWSLVWSLILQVKFENTEYLSENYALTKRLKSKNCMKVDGGLHSMRT